jgi:SnoaL-like domain
VQLSRLVIEHGWRTDHGRADTVHELYVDDGELTLGTTAAPIRGGGAIFEWVDRWSKRRRGTAFATCAETCASLFGPNAAEGTTLLTVFQVEKPGIATTLPRRSRR